MSKKLKRKQPTLAAFGFIKKVVQRGEEVAVNHTKSYQKNTSLTCVNTYFLISLKVPKMMTNKKPK